MTDKYVSIDVRCPTCLVLPETRCRFDSSVMSTPIGRAHDQRVQRARDWNRLVELSEALGIGEYPEMHDVEFFVRFGNDHERASARELRVLTTELDYTEPGDQEAA